MSLIVARANAAGLIIASDSRACYVSRDARRPRARAFPANPLEGVLKAVVLNHSQCIAFAGDVEVARETIIDLGLRHLHLCRDDELVLEHLLRAHLESEGATDFLLGSVLGEPVLHEIKDGAVRRDVGATWLGSHAAFSAYQELYLTLREGCGERASGADELNLVRNSMHQLLEGERQFDDVGDFLIQVATSEHGLVYEPYAVAWFPTWSTSSDTSTPVYMGSAATGAFSYGVLCPVAAGIPIVAVYLAHGGFGVVFAPFHAPEPVIMDAATPAQFVDDLERALGFEMTGTVILSDRAVRLRRHAVAT